MLAYDADRSLPFGGVGDSGCTSAPIGNRDPELTFKGDRITAKTALTPSHIEKVKSSLTLKVTESVHRADHL